MTQGRLCIALKALAEYAYKYNPKIYEQLTRFIERIQEESLRYSWTFLRRWVRKVIEGLGRGKYDLEHIPACLMMAQLARDMQGKNTVAVASANKLDCDPYVKDVKQKNACAFYNRLKGNDKGCTKEETDCTRDHVCACCGKSGHIFWNCAKISKKWKKRS